MDVSLSPAFRPISTPFAFRSPASCRRRGRRSPLRPGLDSVLQIHLATLFSNVEVSYTIPDGAMTNDWKWVLRSSPATRPITRYLPDIEPDIARPLNCIPRIFSGTRAMLSMSGGDGGLIDSDSALADFGTGFALSTNIFGKNQVQVGGHVWPEPELRTGGDGAGCHLQPQRQWRIRRTS